VYKRQIYIWAGVFVFLGVANSKWLLSENLQIFSTINTGIGALSNVILNYFLIKSYGINGAAWATMISYALSAYLLLFVYKKTRIGFYNLTKSLLFITISKRLGDLNKS
jgi:Na+-driven multidrug efflux pump